jgi:hypothetical protein
LTIEALWKAHQYANPPAVTVSAALDQLRDQLQFPRPPQESLTEPGGKSVVPRVDSPTNFDPQGIAERFKPVCAQIRKLLPRSDPR